MKITKEILLKDIEALGEALDQKIGEMNLIKGKIMACREIVAALDKPEPPTPVAPEIAEQSK
jgi:hypothetical protein